MQYHSTVHSQTDDAGMLRRGKRIATTEAADALNCTDQCDDPVIVDCCVSFARWGFMIETIDNSSVQLLGRAATRSAARVAARRVP